MATFNLKASQVPVPIAVPAPSFGQPVNPFPTGQTYPPPGTSLIFNQVAAALRILCQNSAGGYGILSGCGLFINAGLQIGVNPGILVGDGILELTTATPLGTAPFLQAPVPNPYTLADNALNFVWLTNTGSLVAATTLGFPATARWPLGNVTTSGGVITNIDASGVVSLVNGRFTRQTADIGQPTDTPGYSLDTLTTTGLYSFKGSTHVFNAPPPNVQTLSSMLALTPLSPTVQFLRTNGSDQHVRLPAVASIPAGRAYSIFNSDSAHSIIIDDSTGSNKTTLTAGQAITIPVFLDSSGNPTLPASYVPGVPSAAAPSFI